MKNIVFLEKILVVLALGWNALFAQYTFYFLPPSDDKWIAGSSYLRDGDVDTTGKMSVDTTKSRCGWFKKEFKSVDDIPEKAMIYLGLSGREKLGANGMDADLNNPAWIPLRASFGTSNTLYLIGDGLKFSTTAPGPQGEEEAGRCSYKMAAFIYDTDGSVNPSFSGVYKAPTADNNGLRRGIVKATLDTFRVIGTDTLRRKPTFIAKPGYANWVSEESFNAAFTPKGKIRDTITNIPRCYDMSFGRATNGTWEFDSDRMLTPPGPDLVGGFYPYILDSAYTLTDVDADYTDCPACRNEYEANCSFPIDTNFNNAQATFTYENKKVTYKGLEAFNRANERLADGWNNTAPYNVYNTGTYTCPAPRTGPNGEIRTGIRNGRTVNLANLSFCFESHGEFAYESGQEFFFRGDDDIWVFINDKLVIDLGGVHNPAPGYVDLDTLGLVEGDKYPIDIFFCERMGTQSNVRVSTNMYMTQKSGFYPEPPDIYENWMCATITTGGNDCSATGGSRQADLCGVVLIKEGYTVDFYMVRADTLYQNRTDTLFLSEPRLSTQKRSEGCYGTGNAFECFVKDVNDPTSGIKVDSAVYSCGGRKQCKGQQSALKKVDIPHGSWTVYASLVDKNGKTVGKPALIDNIKSVTNARMVWGNLNTEDNGNPKLLKDAYGLQTKKEQSIINGKSTPIYIAGGAWKDTTTYTSFIYENDPDAIASISYTIMPITGLKITSDSLGEKNAAGITRTLPPGGIDTLWVTGDDYYMGVKEFDINLKDISNSAETPSLKLTIYQPALRFTETPTNDNDFVYPPKPNTANGYLRWTNPDPNPPFVGKALPVYLVAWDTVQNKLCDHCNFLLSEASTTNNPSLGDGIVYSDAVKIVNGKQTIYIRGSDVVIGADSATWRISGPSKSVTFAEWTGLQFRDAPIPMPLESYVYDRNGDGIGDSLIVKFSKSFEENGKIAKNLLPILLKVTWETGNTVAFHSPNRKLTDLEKIESVKTFYNEGFYEENYNYWSKYLTDSITITIADSTTAFSKDVLTFGYNSGKGDILSYTPYYDLNDSLRYVISDASVLDRIPPIVVRATYKMDTRTCGSSKSDYCTDGLEVSLSEPVFADPDADDDLIKNPFSYCFEYSQSSACKGTSEIQTKNMKWNNIGLNGYDKWTWETTPEADYAYSAKYKPSQRNNPPKYYEGASGGDNNADLTYRSYEGVRTPKATDWVKIRPPKVGPLVAGYEGVDVLRDAAGNSANPREIGVLISGGNRYDKEQNKIASVDINDTTPLAGIFLPGSKKPVWVTDKGRIFARDSLFRDTSITEYLPIPKGYPIDSVKKNYPGSVGTIINHGIIHDWVKDALIADDCKDETTNKTGSSKCEVKTRDGRTIPLKFDDSSYAEAVTLHASVFYHTNLGDYTAHKNPVEARCTDPIFQGSPVKRPQYGNNCLGNEYDFYLAWDLKSNKGRYVGTGAYVAVTKSYLQVDYIWNGEPKSIKLNPDESVEMFGARRVTRE